MAGEMDRRVLAIRRSLESVKGNCLFADVPVCADDASVGTDASHICVVGTGEIDRAQRAIGEQESVRATLEIHVEARNDAAGIDALGGRQSGIRNVYRGELVGWRRSVGVRLPRSKSERGGWLLGAPHGQCRGDEGRGGDVGSSRWNGRAHRASDRG